MESKSQKDLSEEIATLNRSIKGSVKPDEKLIKLRDSKIEDFKKSIKQSNASSSHSSEKSTPTGHKEKSEKTVEGTRVPSEMKKSETTPAPNPRSVVEGPEAGKNLSTVTSISKGHVSSDKNEVESFKRQIESNSSKSQTIPKGQITNSKEEVNEFKSEASKRESNVIKPMTINQNQIENRVSSKGNPQSQSSKIKADLCFLIDATGSMGKWIDSVKVKVGEIITLVTETYGNVDFRVGYYAYRDFDTKDEAPFKFTRNPRELEQCLAKVQPHGGDDGPEDINGALQHVLEMNWESDIKILAHFADAPCHGTQFHNFSDSHPDPKSDKPWENIFYTMQKQGIRYNFLELVPEATRKMTDKFQEIWKQASQVSSKKVDYRAKFNVYNVKDTKDLLDSIVISTKNSIKESLKNCSNAEELLKKLVKDCSSSNLYSSL